MQTRLPQRVGFGGDLPTDLLPPVVSRIHVGFLPLFLHLPACIGGSNYHMDTCIGGTIDSILEVAL